MSKVVIFYTVPPRRIYYNYIIVNANKPDLFAIRYNAKNIRGVIIDSGVEIFRDPQVKEYPKGAKAWMLYLIRLYYRIKYMCKNKCEIYVTIPDYPDDYVSDWGKEHNLWVNGKTNVDRTIENIKLALDQFSEIPWLIPVQGFYMKPDSVVKTIMRLEDLGILDDYEYFAIANLCTTRSVNVIVEAVQKVHNYLTLRGYRKRLHVFGPSIRAVAKIWRIIYSFDSLSYSKPLGILKIRGYNFSCKTGEQRRLYFLTWLLTLTKKYKVELDGVDMSYYERLFYNIMDKFLDDDPFQ